MSVAWERSQDNTQRKAPGPHRDSPNPLATRQQCYPPNFIDTHMRIINNPNNYIQLNNLHCRLKTTQHEPEGLSRCYLIIKHRLKEDFVLSQVFLIHKPCLVHRLHIFNLKGNFALISYYCNPSALSYPSKFSQSHQNKTASVADYRLVMFLTIIPLIYS